MKKFILDTIKTFRGDGEGAFTMIELLVVIAVIGVLAVAVLSSLNPIEQINKGRDTRKESDAAQLISAVDRYYALQELYPWNVTGATNPEDLFERGTGDDFTWADELVTAEEVKDGYVNRIQSEDSMFVFKDAGANENSFVCFVPSSQAFKTRAARECAADLTHRLTISGTTTCTSTDGTVNDTNMICLP